MYASGPPREFWESGVVANRYSGLLVLTMPNGGAAIYSKAVVRELWNMPASMSQRCQKRTLETEAEVDSNQAMKLVD